MIKLSKIVWLLVVIAARLLAMVAIAVLGAWGVGAILYELPGGETVRIIAAAILGGLAVLTAASLFARRLRPAAAAFAALLAGIVIWWSTIAPSNERDFAPELSQALGARFDGDAVTVANVRDFEWRSATEFKPRWEERTFDLGAVRTIDLFNIYWMGPLIAHPIISFGFADGRQLTFSIEIRRETKEQYSALAGFFKQYELTVVGADERDIMALRDLNHEQTLLFRLRASPPEARALLTEYLNKANSLRVAPEFYNTLTSNCTVGILRLVRRLTNRYPLDWRILFNGYLPEYLDENRLLDPDLTIADLRRLGDISGRYRDGLDSVAFSAMLREGVPKLAEPRSAP